MGQFQECLVEFPDLDLILRTKPGDAYFFAAKELNHKVGSLTGIGDKEPERWSWITFTHGKCVV